VSTFGLLVGDLTDDLVEALTEEFLSDGTNATFTGLALH
jgi:hypothetical protein